MDPVGSIGKFDVLAEGENLIGFKFSQLGERVSRLMSDLLQNM